MYIVAKSTISDNRAGMDRVCFSHRCILVIFFNYPLVNLSYIKFFCIYHSFRFFLKKNILFSMKISTSYRLIVVQSVVLVIFMVVFAMRSVFPYKTDARVISPEIIQSVSPSVVMMIQGDNFVGAGSIIDVEKGLILTSKHLLASQNFIRTQVGYDYPIIRMSETSIYGDVALVQIVPDSVFRQNRAVKIISSQNSLQSGDDVISFGTFALSKSIILMRGIISDPIQHI